jgi:hypothetical protein
MDKINDRVESRLASFVPAAPPRARPCRSDRSTAEVPIAEANSALVIPESAGKLGDLGRHRSALGASPGASEQISNQDARSRT